MRYATVLLAGPVLLALAAGCIDDSDYPMRLAPSIDASAEASTPAFLRATVLEDGDAGRPISTALVGVYELTPKGYRGSPLASGEADGLGKVTLAVEPGKRIIVGASAGGQWTTEQVEGVTTPAAGDQVDLTIALYRTRIDATWTTDWGNPALHLSGAKYDLPGDRKWLPTSGVFSPNPDLDAAYVSRLVYLKVVANWTNSPTSHADLGIGIGPADGQLVLAQDAEEQGVNAGHVEETAVFTGRDLVDAGLREPRELFVGPFTDAPLVGPLGLVVTMTLQAEFASVANADIPQPVPGPSLFLVLAVLLGGLLVWRRRGPA